MSETNNTEVATADEHPVEHGLERQLERDLEHAMEPAPGLLPGELYPHPSPFQYVIIAVVLCVITALEVGLYYLQDDLAKWLIIPLLLAFAFLKFVLVASWYMHLKTDKHIYRRFFILGGTAAIILYLIVLATLHVFSGGPPGAPHAP